jgi:hypothetical protein
MGVTDKRKKKAAAPAWFSSSFLRKRFIERMIFCRKI